MSSDRPILLVFSRAVLRVERLNWSLWCLSVHPSIILSMDTYNNFQNFKILLDFKNSETKVCFRTFWATLVFGPPRPPLLIWLDTFFEHPSSLHLTPHLHVSSSMILLWSHSNESITRCIFPTSLFSFVISEKGQYGIYERRADAPAACLCSPTRAQQT